MQRQSSSRSNALLQLISSEMLLHVIQSPMQLYCTWSSKQQLLLQAEAINLDVGSVHTSICTGVKANRTRNNPSLESRAWIHWDNDKHGVAEGCSVAFVCSLLACMQNSSLITDATRSQLAEPRWLPVCPAFDQMMRYSCRRRYPEIHTFTGLCTSSCRAIATFSDYLLSQKQHATAHML